MAKAQQVSRRRYETMCSCCDQIVGVIYTPFNRDMTSGSHAPVPKTSRHKAGKVWCRGSQLSIPEAMLIPVHMTGAVA